MDNKAIILREPVPWVRALVGQKIGRLLAIEFIGFLEGTAIMKCQCDCGETTLSHAAHLKSGAARSCGCARKETLRRIKTKHGHSPFHGKCTKVYRSWKAMRERCRNPNNLHYMDYGGRGIVVCERWDDFRNFFSDMGHPPTNRHTIERINNNGNYEPSNCCWATPPEQAQNQRSNWHVILNGEEITVAEATRRSGLRHARIYKFLYDTGASKDAKISIDDFVSSITRAA